MEDLSSRERKILGRLVNCFIDTGEPVGSRTLSKRGMDLSAATVRNSVADLEEKGYLFQPHTSAGRVATDKGYRVFVDTLMEQQQVSEEDRKRLAAMVQDCIRESNVESLIGQVSRVIAEVSHQLGVALTPRFNKGIFRSLEMVQLTESKLLLILTIQSGLVKTLVMEVDARIRKSDLDATRRVVNERLAGLTIEDMLKEVEERLMSSSEGAPKLLRMICDNADNLFEVIHEEDLHLVGTGNFFMQPEFADQQARMVELIGMFEERTQMAEILSSRVAEDGIAITIGEENASPQLKDCSLLTSKYRFGNVTGVIGMMGPTRMPYSKMVPLLRYIAGLTETMLEAKTDTR
jgi:heat-inducible transcriptional repressor